MVADGGIGAVDGRLDVDAALARVPDPFRAAVVLRDVCDLDYAEIARVLDIPVGTVRSRIARGRASLSGLLGNPAAPSDRPTTSPMTPDDPRPPPLPATPAATRPDPAGGIPGSPVSGPATRARPGPGGDLPCQGGPGGRDGDDADPTCSSALLDGVLDDADAAAAR